MIYNFSLNEALFVLLNSILFYCFLIIPLFFIFCKIFYYNKTLAYLPLYSIFFYHLPCVIILYFLPLSLIIQDEVLSLTALFIFSWLYSLPLVFFLNKYIFAENNLKSLIKIFLIFNFIQSLTAIIIYIILK
ncbi:hypothetical protein ABSA28_00525 [Candidatus Hepatincolaceae symbiont of Richtersius coronifer]